MSKETTAASGGIGLLGWLGLLFIGLKLTGYISWSWWWVLLPWYGPVALGLAAAFICLLIAGLIKLLD